MIKTKILVAMVALFAIYSTGAEAKLYKWVDDKGEVHYDEVIPPEYAGKQHVQIEKGHEVKPQVKNKDGSIKATQEETPEEIEQKRHDQALLGTFTNEAEIDLARDRNLQQVNARTTGTQMRIKSAQEDVNGYQKEKDALIKAGKPVDKGLQDLYDQAAARLAKLQIELNQSLAEAAAIQARYDADKKRYRELKSGGK